MRPFLDAVAAGGLLFDGAMGSLLYERGVFLNHCFEEINLSQPDLIRQIHADYLQAGARVLTTNTFGASTPRLAAHGLAEQMEAINTAGVRLAQEIAGGRAYVAGSVGPTGIGLDTLTRPEGLEAIDALEAQLMVLLKLDVDVILFETFGVLQELELITRRARAHTTKPLIALYKFKPSGLGAEGQTPRQVAKRLIEAGADVIGANCGGGPDLMFDVAPKMVGLGAPVLAQGNAGRPSSVEERTIYVANPEYFGVFARRLLKAGVAAVGGCCGTRPEHIRRMANATRMMSADAAVAPRVEITAAPRAPAATPLKDRSPLGAALAEGRFATSVELNPPLGFDLDKQLRAARALQAFGVTTVNIADGPRASLRMGNLAMARLLIEAGVQPALHVCCRDRSFLGLQAHLLAAHVLGVRDLVIITGDPPKMGPYPHSTGVYDIDSVGLLRVLADFNRGVDPAGKPMPAPTAFVCATGAEPAAIDYERELRRLEMKRDAGADVVLTQPVYDPFKITRFLDDVASLGLPVMLGLCPLASLRNAQFLNDNVPGMSVPDYILARMAAADARGEGQAEGVAIAREALDAVRHRVQGAYIMPPFGRHKLAMKVLEGFI
ncbi:bifunctional homocysteine S-methyltransferase/methylenetetrahydrofolate reductase [Myxococcota bacterium]|nr:bifunctional homocysteine S-methyltransferase/methylenetetrahydrofolate reductase [Myxococcota bacterium]MBU1431755.1 bifunctional homocysteine S-methyltransferase/methylenetetrahydrofolate reductase [Myxococcota bacterium]MBU1897450.1 bifunctional homocysteine S-methyltransferase/methylenetetrahydrofolate reductase [Myxococcota bacterium]